MNSDRGYSTRTFQNEAQLPRVPLPDLATSGERLIEWCRPLLTFDELKQTRAAVDELLAPGGDGHVLQAGLERFEADPDTPSWLDVFWPYRYLGRRDRIALNANFFFLFRDARDGEAQVPGFDAQLARAAHLIADAVALKQRLDDEQVPPVMLRGAPQTMEQYKYLFSTTRIPGPELDSVRAPYSKEWPGPSTARHIVVLIGGRMVRLDVQDPDGRPYPVAEVAEGLRAIRDAATPSGRDESVGHLTTMARAEWAERRGALRDLDPANAAGLESIESALFCLCLDGFEPADDQQACDRLLHGDSANRWFDKAVSLIVFGNGRAGINVEHCELDGTTILSFVDNLLDPPADQAEVAAYAEGTPKSEPVEFVLDDDLRAAIGAARDSFARFGADTATTVVHFDDFSASHAKQLGMSPDAFVQMAYQLAHLRAKGRIGATYESIATRQYRHGRTEAMRVVTPEVLGFVAAMTDPSTDAATKREAFRAAATAHVTRAKDCQQGRAPEQHLWELQLIQRRRGEELGVTEVPSLYSSPGWLIMRDDYLSTSSAPSVNIEYFGFGSTSSQCIGVAYVLLPDHFNLYLSTPGAVADQMATFIEELRTAITELSELLASGE